MVEGEEEPSVSVGYGGSRLPNWILIAPLDKAAFFSHHCPRKRGQLTSSIRVNEESNSKGHLYVRSGPSFYVFVRG